MANRELARINPQQPIWNEEDKALIRQTVAKGATDSEFKLLLYTAAKYDLDPLVKQIWCVKYNDKPAAIYTSRDGFLHMAHKSGQFDGMETVAIKEGGNLVGARCTVYRKGCNRPFVVEVALSEYLVKQNPGDKPNQWAIRPETMIKKVAESQCLRRAFDISGLYEPGEIPEDGSSVSVVETTARPVEAPQEPAELRPEIRGRLDEAHEIKHLTAITTITNTFGNWASITKDQCLSGLRALIGTTNFEEAAAKVGIDKFGPVIKYKYPDADIAGKMHSAILHYVYSWQEDEKEKTQQQIPQLPNATITGQKVEPIDPAIQDRLHRAAWIEEAAQVQTVTPAGKWMNVTGDQFDKAAKLITGGRDLMDIIDAMGIDKFSTEAKKRFPTQLKTYDQQLAAGLHILAEWCENHPAETIFPDVEGDNAAGDDFFADDEEFDDDQEEYIK